MPKTSRMLIKKIQGAVALCLLSGSLMAGTGAAPGFAGLPIELVSEFSRFVTMNGSATPEQTKIRLAAALEFLEARTESARKDPVAVIREALRDPQLATAGTGEAIVAAASGGGAPCQGPGQGSCERRYCNDREMCVSAHEFHLEGCRQFPSPNCVQTANINLTSCQLVSWYSFLLCDIVRDGCGGVFNSVRMIKLGANPNGPLTDNFVIPLNFARTGYEFRVTITEPALQTNRVTIRVGNDVVFDNLCALGGGRDVFVPVRLSPTGNPFQFNEDPFIQIQVQIQQDPDFPNCSAPLGTVSVQITCIGLP